MSEMAKKISNSLRESARIFVLQDIVCSRRDPTGRTAMERMEERFQYEKFSPNKLDFVLFSFHRRSGWEHFHAYHSCSYRKSYCSCGMFKTQNVIPSRRRTLRVSQLSEEDIAAILKYNCASGRQVHLLTIKGIPWRYTPDSSTSASSSSVSEGLVEECDHTNSNIPDSGRKRPNPILDELKEVILDEMMQKTDLVKRTGSIQ